jgi:outer membrane protein OmpA-like peptidoglycan-associated protein
MKKIISILITTVFMITLLSCAGQTNQQRGSRTGVAVGAGVGAILGQVIGRNTGSTLLGAGIGAILGGIAGDQIGSYMDRQEQDLRNAMAASEYASLQRSQDVLIATFKSDVFFDFNSSILKPGGYSEITRISNVLNKYPQTTIRVEGHTDSVGSESYNQQLSRNRADAVANTLVQKGIDSRRITTVGFGESQPISSNNATNRRVNIVITPIEKG